MLSLKENYADFVDNIMYFDSDDDFYRFCVNPTLVTQEYTKADGSDGYVADWNYSDEYLRALQNGIHFIIKDEDSQIFKHGEITHRVNTRPIDNLLPYYKEPKNKIIKEIIPLDTYINDEKNI